MAAGKQRPRLARCPPPVLPARETDPAQGHPPPLALHSPLLTLARAVRTVTLTLKIVAQRGLADLKKTEHDLLGPPALYDQARLDASLTSTQPEVVEGDRIDR